MIKTGGSTFTPGAAESLTISGLDATASTAVLKLGTLEVSGSLSGSDWVFAFTADDSGSLKPHTRYNPQIVYNTGEATAIRLTTGARKEATTAVAAPSATVVAEITGGNGITTAPSSGIVDKGSISIDSSWVTANLLQMNVGPEPGSSNAVTTAFRVWSRSQSAMVNLVAETFYQAAGGSNPTGDIILRSSGVEDVYMYWGYSILHTGATRSLPTDTTASSSGVGMSTNGSLYYFRGSSIDDSSDGYQISVLYEATQ